MSEETKEIDNVISLVEEAQKKGKFNLADAIKGRSFPQKSIDVYIDANSAFQLEIIRERMNEIGGLENQEEFDRLEAEAAALVQKIKDSRLTFTMRGVGQGVVEEAMKAADEAHPDDEEQGSNPEWTKHYLSYLVAKNIVKVADADGNEDDSAFSVEDILTIRDTIPVDSWGVLIETMQQLTLANSYFNVVTDAGFLPKS